MPVNDYGNDICGFLHDNKQAQPRWNVMEDFGMIQASVGEIFKQALQGSNDNGADAGNLQVLSVI